MKLVTVFNKIYLCSIALFVAVLQGDPNMPQDLFNIHQYRGLWCPKTANKIKSKM